MARTVRLETTPDGTFVKCLCDKTRCRRGSSATASLSTDTWMVSARSPTPPGLATPSSISRTEFLVRRDLTASAKAASKLSSNDVIVKNTFVHLVESCSSSESESWSAQAIMKANAELFDVFDDDNVQVKGGITQTEPALLTSSNVSAPQVDFKLCAMTSPNLQAFKVRLTRTGFRSPHKQLQTLRRQRKKYRHLKRNSQLPRYTFLLRVPCGSLWTARSYKLVTWSRHRSKFGQGVFPRPSSKTALARWQSVMMTWTYPSSFQGRLLRSIGF